MLVALMPFFFIARLRGISGTRTNVRTYVRTMTELPLTFIIISQLLMKNVLEQTFALVRYNSVFVQRCFQSNITFQSNCVEDLHFSAFSL